MNRVKAALSTIGGAFTSLAKSGISRLSLVPSYLSHLLWLISQEFAELTKHAYGGNAAVYAALRVLCTSVAEPPLVTYTRQPDGQAGSPIGYTDPLAVLIRSPNPYMTEFEFWELSTIHCAICGISVWWKERANSGQLLALWPLRPDRVGPIYGDASAGEPMLLGWSYLEPGTSHYIGIPAADVLTFNLPDPLGESGGIVEGFGPLQALASEVSADNEATKFVGTLVSNYASPGVVVQVQGKITSQDDAKLIKAGFMQQFGGRKRGEPAVIDSGTTIQPVGFSLRDLEFRDLRKVSESRICAALGVPAILTGLLVGLEAGIRATIAEQREEFAERTLAAYWRRFSDQYTKDVAAEFGSEYICKFDLTKVRALVQQSLQDYMKIQGAYEREALTKNELREALGYPKRDDGDVYASGIAPGRGMETLVPANPDNPDVDEETPTNGSPVAVAQLPDNPSTDKPTRASRPGTQKPPKPADTRASDEDDATAEARALIQKAIDLKMGTVKSGKNGH